MASRPSDSALPVFCLRGPTASGKTAVAMALAETLPVDIISVDSAMIYRGMDIGTAKPDRDELERVPHRLIDIRDPSESYSAAAFREDALRAIRQSHVAGRMPLLVGGTMLYFRALEEGLSALPSADPGLRQQLEERASKEGWPSLHAQLARLDPLTAARLHPNDAQRVQRALEVCLASGRPMSALQQNRQTLPKPALRFVRLALPTPDRTALHRRIRQRFLAMLDAGFENEVRHLRDRGDLNLNQPAMRAVGYRQMWMYLDGVFGYDEMISRAVAATRQYAKRQLTWLRRDDTVRLLEDTGAVTLANLRAEMAREQQQWLAPFAASSERMDGALDSGCGENSRGAP